ncbi:MAG: hypothetical protein AAGF23_06180 [Acidobacteriota bacterium]
MIGPRGTARARVLAPVLGLAFAVAASTPGFAQDILYSPDITLIGGGTLSADEDVARDVGGASVTELAGLPAAVDLVAFESLDGTQFLVFDTAVEVDGEIFQPSDVAISDGGGLEIFFKGQASGIPPGVRIDALAVNDGGELFFSIDIDAEIEGEIYRDDDVIFFDGSYQVIFKGQSSGVPANLDIDALAVVDGGDLVMSFDVGGTIAGIQFGDEDMLFYDGGWALFEKGQSLSSSFAAGDLDALALADPINIGLIFADGFESGDVSAWDALIN